MVLTICSTFRNFVSLGCVGAFLAFPPSTVVAQTTAENEAALQAIGFSPVAGVPKVFSVDAFKACTSDNVPKSPSDRGTAMLGINIASDICTNVNSLNERGYACQLRGQAVSYPEGQTVYNSYMLQGISCTNDQREITFSLPDFVARVPASAAGSNDVEILSEAHWFSVFFGGSDPEYGSKTAFVVEAWSAAATSTDVAAIQINCSALNACAETGRDLAQFLVSNLDSLSVMNIDLVEQRNLSQQVVGLKEMLVGVSEFGEVFSVSSVNDPGASVLIDRGTLNDFSPGGMTLD